MYALKKFGIEETDRTKLYKFIGPPLTESFEKFYGFTKEQSLDGVKYYREYYHDKGIYENRVYDGLEEVLKKINEAGKQAIVATSKPEKYAKIIIDHFHLTKYFACVAGMEMDGGRGTKAQVITYALEKNDITDKSKVLMMVTANTMSRRHEMDLTVSAFSMDLEAAKNLKKPEPIIFVKM